MKSSYIFLLVSCISCHTIAPSAPAPTAPGGPKEVAQFTEQAPPPYEAGSAPASPQIEIQDPMMQFLIEYRRRADGIYEKEPEIKGYLRQNIAYISEIELDEQVKNDTITKMNALADECAKKYYLPIRQVYKNLNNFQVVQHENYKKARTAKLAALSRENNNQGKQNNCCALQ